jgi:hypothetical protein
VTEKSCHVEEAGEAPFFLRSAARVSRVGLSKNFVWRPVSRIGCGARLLRSRGGIEKELHMLHYKLIRLAAILLVMIMYASTAKADLVAWYPLHGADGSPNVGDFYGDLVNGPTPAPDEKGTANGALKFQALSTNNSSAYSRMNTGSYVSVPNGAPNSSLTTDKGLPGLQQGTIALWVNWSGMQGTGWNSVNFGSVTARQGDGVFSNNVIGISDADPNVGTLTWRPYGAGAAVAVGATPVGDNVWHFVAVTWDGTTGEHDLYLDGKLDGQDNSGTNIGPLHANANARFTIGAWIDDGSTYSNSTIHDVYIFNTVLSQDQIKALQATGIPP